MFSHAPENYKCPICLGIQGLENEDTLLKQADLVYKDELVSVFINSFWIDTVRGHVIVVPNQHFENIYELPTNVGERISSIVKKMAITIKKAYKCDGITTRQNNEPAGNNPNWRTLSEPEFITELQKKVLEEAAEVPRTKDPKEVIEELADIQEIIDNLHKITHDLTVGVFCRMQRRFAQNLFCLDPRYKL